MIAPAGCERCKDTGRRKDDPDTGAEVYCECPIGEAFSAAWMGMGHEEEIVEAIEAMRVHLLAKREKERQP